MNFITINKEDINSIQGFYGTNNNKINGSEILKTEENPPQLSEVKHDIPKEKIRLQSSNKPKD